MPSLYRKEFLVAVGCFLLAALTGVLLRFVGAGLAMPQGLDFTNVRRAHSHLMLFGWVTPALFIAIAGQIGPSRAASRILRVTLVLALLSYLPFFVWGYGAAPIGDARVPLSVIVSTASMFCWYAFAVFYVRRRVELRRACGALAVAFWDGAMVHLCLGSLGAWARGAFVGMKIDDPLLTAGSIEFFLSSFADGFLLLGVLGLLFARRVAPHEEAVEKVKNHNFESEAWWGLRGAPPRGSGRSPASTPCCSSFPLSTYFDSLHKRCQRGVVLAYLLAAAVLFEFPALLPVRIVDPGLRIVGSVGVALAGGLAAFFGARMFFMGARIPGALLLVLGASKLLLIDAAIADALLAWGMRIPYLHLLLAGLVTTVLLEHAQARWPATFGAAPIKSAIAAMLVGLWPTTALWPLMVSRELGLIFTALTALLPVVAVGWMLRPRSPGVPLREGRSPCPR